MHLHSRCRRQPRFTGGSVICIFGNILTILKSPPSVMGEKSTTRWSSKRRGPYMKRRHSSYGIAAPSSTQGSTATNDGDMVVESTKKRPKEDRVPRPRRPGDNFALIVNASEGLPSYPATGLINKTKQGVHASREQRDNDAMLQWAEEESGEPVQFEDVLRPLDDAWSNEDGDVELSHEEPDECYGESTIERDDTVLKNGGMKLTWTNVASLITATGSTRLNGPAYQTLANFRNWQPNRRQVSLRLPSISTLRRTIRSFAKSNFFVPGQVLMFPVDFAKSGAKPGVGKHASKTHAPTMVVKVSDWAKMDFSTRIVQDIVEGRSDVHNDDCEQPRFLSIEDTPIVRDRGRSLSVYRIPLDCGDVEDLRKGMKLSIKVESTPGLEARLHSGGYQTERQGIATAFEAVVDTFSTNGEGIELGFDGGINFKGKQKKTRRAQSRAFLPSDVVVRLLPEWSEASSLLHGCEKDTFVYLVYRMRRRNGCDDDYAVSIVAASHNSPKELERLKGAEYRHAFEKGRVRGVSRSNVDASSEMETEHHERIDAESRGVLEDGRKYVVYRVFLYSDGFTPYVGKKGSMGGVYMLPVGMLPEHRNGAGAIRPIGLTPPGVSTNEVLSALIEDIIEGTTKGFESVDSKGEKIVIFLDVVGYVGDYPAISHTVDLLGHCSNVPCHLCTYERYDKSGGNGSKYGHTTSINSAHPSFSRSEGRSVALRACKLSKAELQALGMSDEDTFETSLQALHVLAARLEKARDEEKVPRRAGDKKPVVPARFDAYRSCVVAPDHLFLGLGRDIMNVCITLLPPSVRRVFESIAKQALRENYLIVQDSLVNHEKHVLHSMTISSMYCLLSVAPRAMESAWHIHNNGCENHTAVASEVEDALRLLRVFLKLINRTQYYPKAKLDGLDQVVGYNADGGRKRLKELQQAASRYVSGVDKLCRKSSTALSCLDRPNLHRLLEFYTHTLPLFGSVRHVQELLFEGAHQPMKRGVAHSNMKNAQLQSMGHRLANDWKTRLAIETDAVGNDGEGWTFDCARSVLNLLGYDASRLDLETHVGQLQDAFPPPVIDHLRNHRKELISSATGQKDWRVEKADLLNLTDTVNGYELETLRAEEQFIQESNHYLQALWSSKLCLRSGTVDGSHDQLLSVSVYSGAKWCKISNSKRGERTSCMARIGYGSVVQAVCDENALCSSDEEADGVHMLGSTDPTGKRTFWMVIAVFEVQISRKSEGDGDKSNGTEERRLYCAVRMCVFDEDGNVRVCRNSNEKYILELSNCVRASMVMHCCENELGVHMEGGFECCMDERTGLVKHSHTLAEGGVYEIKGRLEGFPPRRA